MDVSTSARNQVISRLLAAFIMGFIFINTLGVLTVLLLPVERLVAISWVMFFVFLMYAVVIMWVFYETSLKKVWWSLSLGSVLCGLLSAGILYWESLS